MSPSSGRSRFFVNVVASRTGASRLKPANDHQPAVRDGCCRASGDAGAATPRAGSKAGPLRRVRHRGDHRSRSPVQGGLTGESAAAGDLALRVPRHVTERHSLRRSSPRVVTFPSRWSGARHTRDYFFWCRAPSETEAP
jgi:hypothetical protein